MGLRAQLLCAECLGLLGAVDPARLSLNVRTPDKLCASTEELLVDLVTKHLVRLLRVAASLQTLDATTFAIQVRIPRQAHLQLQLPCMNVRVLLSTDEVF